EGACVRNASTVVYVNDAFELRLDACAYLVSPNAQRGIVRGFWDSEPAPGMLQSSSRCFSSELNAGLPPVFRSESAHPESRYLRKTPFIACSNGVILCDCGGADHQIAFPHRNAAYRQISPQRGVYSRD